MNLKIFFCCLIIIILIIIVCFALRKKEKTLSECDISDIIKELKTLIKLSDVGGNGQLTSSKNIDKKELQLYIIKSDEKKILNWYKSNFINIYNKLIKIHNLRKNKKVYKYVVELYILRAKPHDFVFTPIITEEKQDEIVDFVDHEDIEYSELYPKISMGKGLELFKESIKFSDTNDEIQEFNIDNTIL